MTVTARPGVRLGHGVLELGEGRSVRPIGGSVHYWRHRHEEWGRVLDAVVELGVEVVDTYVPWSAHEAGSEPPRWTGSLDVERFLGLCMDRELRVIVRPGPHGAAEMADSGLPRRVVDDPRTWALRSSGLPYVLPTATHHIRVPSYASTHYLAAVEGWYAEVIPRLAALQWPDGPIVACQVDNEHGFFFQAHAFALDYHPQALGEWRRFVVQRHGSLEAVARAYGIAAARLDDLQPPRDGDDPVELRRLDWVAWREQHIRDSLGHLASRMRAHGMTGVPLLHNDYPRFDTPLDLGALEASGAVDVAAIDVYADRRGLRFVTDTVRAAATNSRFAWLAECGCGWLALPWLLPMGVDPRDTEATTRAALLAGARGLTLYMLAERERWFGSAIDNHGRLRPELAAVIRRIATMVRTLRLEELERESRVLIVDSRPDSRRRAAQAVLGSAVPAFTAQLPLDPMVTLRAPEAAEAERAAWRAAVEATVHAAGVDWDRATSSSLPPLDGYDCVLVACAGSLEASACAALREASHRGAAVLVGPALPELDELLRPLPAGAGPVPSAVPTEDVAGALRAVCPEPAVRVTGEGVSVHRWHGPGRELVGLVHTADTHVQVTLWGAGVTGMRDLESGAALACAGDAWGVSLAPYQSAVIGVDRQGRS